MSKPIWIHIPQFTRRLTKWDGFWWIAGIVIVLLIGGILSWCFWEDLNDGKDSLSTTVRNVALVIGGVIAMLLAVWRSRVAERQAATAQQGLMNERYQKAAEMLGSSVLAVRLGGIDALQGLAEQNPEQYHVPVMKQLCSFVRHPTEVEGQPTVDSSEIERGQFYGASTAQDYAAAGTFEIEEVREDIQAAIDSIASCHARNLEIETLQNYRLDLHRADLRGANLIAKDLSGAPPKDINGVPSFHYPNHAIIGWWYTDLKEANLRYASLYHANLTNVDLSSALGITQAALDDTYADPKTPPRLNSAFDSETREPLVWRGR